MKFAGRILTLASAFLLDVGYSLTPASSSATSDLVRESKDLSNGAVLGVDISHAPSTMIEGHPINIQGTAHVGKGEADVAYIYVVDSSISTSTSDGECGTVLDCMQAFLQEFHTEATENGSAELVGVIDFDSEATITAHLQHPDSDVIDSAIFAGKSDGGTDCVHAFELAKELVQHPNNTAGTTIVIFASDGECYNTEGTKNAVADLGNTTGAIVHSIAVGEDVDCSSTMDGNNILSDIPQNGGDCISVPDPHTLPHIIDDLIGTTLISMDIRVDDSPYFPFYDTELSMTLPQDGAVAINFDIERAGMVGLGGHIICIRATGGDSLGHVATVENCIRVLVQAKPTPPVEDSSRTSPTFHNPQDIPQEAAASPWETADNSKADSATIAIVASIAVLVPLALAALWYGRKVHQEQQQTTTARMADVVSVVNHNDMTLKEETSEKTNEII